MRKWKFDDPIEAENLAALLDQYGYKTRIEAELHEYPGHEEWRAAGFPRSVHGDLRPSFIHHSHYTTYHVWLEKS